MKIFQRPDKELVLIRTATTMTTGAGAGICAEKFRRRLGAVTRRRKAQNQRGNDENINCFTHSFKFVNGETT